MSIARVADNNTTYYASMKESIHKSLLSWFNDKGIIYETINDQAFVSGNEEAAQSVILNIDGCYYQALLSANYTLCHSILKETFSAKKIAILPLTDYHLNNHYNVLIDKNLTHSNTVLLKTELVSSILKVDLPFFCRKTNAKITNFNLLPNYKTRLDAVTPSHKRELFDKCENPFFGISLENSNFTRPKLLASLEFISNRFKKCTVLIGDSIHRITLKSYNDNLSLEEAFKRAIDLGKKFFHDEKHTFSRFENKCIFDFLFCSEVQQYPDYPLYHDSLKQLFNENEVFKRSIITFGEKYHIKKKPDITEEKWNKLIASSCDYFLEEFAIFCSLYQRNRTCMLYPGSFSTLLEIADGKHPEAPEMLKQLMFACLNIKKR